MIFSMKLDIPPTPGRTHQPGNIYRTNHNTVHLLLGFKDNSRAMVLRFDKQGEFSSFETYGGGYLDHMTLIGRCKVMSDVEWLP